MIYLLLAYLLGAIPFGYLLPKILLGKDVREYGSGNIGFTNVMRTFGLKIGSVVLVTDIAKGFIAVKLAQQTGSLLLPLGAAVCVALGHNYTVFLKFQGGRGIATSAGALLALMPQVVAILFVIWVVVLLISRYVSLASILAAGSFPLLTALAGYPWQYFLFSLALAAMAIYRHKPNIVRLLNGTELKLGQKGEKRNE
ncbi:MAG: glycerol-3-phosphate 1-O-acyltransferase PlsY [Firmicutes bacterium]|nr:glycerol-3-phosphate 1-O-acyltransferase PlsY [Bacillota bacterium]